MWDACQIRYKTFYIHVSHRQPYRKKAGKTNVGSNIEVENEKNTKHFCPEFKGKRSSGDGSIIQQEKQSAHHVRVWRVCVTIFAMEKQQCVRFTFLVYMCQQLSITCIAMKTQQCVLLTVVLHVKANNAKKKNLVFHVNFPILSKLRLYRQDFYQQFLLQNFMEIRPVGDALIHPDRRMD